MKRIVVVGGGSAGLAAVRGLRFAQVEVTLIDRRNHHVFKPLLPQVAAGLLPESAAAVPFRTLIQDQRNVRFQMAEAVYVIPEQNRLILADRTIPYDFLIVATGSRPALAPSPGRSETERSRLAPGLHSASDAIALRNRLLAILETAAHSTEERQKELLRFLLVLGDASGNPEAARRGVEHAAALIEMLRSCLAKDFPEISPHVPRILVSTQQPNIETGLAPRAWQAAERELIHAGVEFLTGRSVKQLLPTELSAMEGAEVTFETVRDGKPVIETLRAGAVIWHAAPQPGDFLTAVLHAARIPNDTKDRAVVNPDLSATGFENLFLAGSAVSARSFRRHSGQEFLEPSRHHSAAQGKHAAAAVLASLRGETNRDFEPARQNCFLWSGRRQAHGALHPLLGTLRVHGWPAWLGWLHREFAPAELGLPLLQILGPVMHTAIGGARRFALPALLHPTPYSTATAPGPAAPKPAPQAPRTNSIRTTRSRSRGAAR